ncbi:NADH ubiquinone oxidoreductase 20 kDa subunit [Thiorhodococcus drewsii AZ1]|uniref:hydrogenase (acceptor) n=1 Tax=Thiorhodococcus drewsii AZ1 TaxID=765913 RepID=G2E384_9GAMM|nr:NADH ubiquinone oxidoreductase [Thiorhodococcus drewsii]EGV30273.1 NADH ubiquinone oxidoreductase 20 kDa subunit [Thiorhodococcus drewsii AZ1]
MANLVWMQTGACSGDSMTLLCAERPSLESLLEHAGARLLWHPSLTAETRFGSVLDAVTSGREPLDILCIEGSLMTGPSGSGLYDTWRSRPKIEIVRELAGIAGSVVAMGTCAAFGGVHAAPPNPTDCTGMQFMQATPGGLLGPGWRSRGGQPVINVAGCPAHPNTMTKVLAMLLEGTPIPLDELNRPAPFFSSLVHQGCTRNEYHEYDAEDDVLGGRGCMFFSLGCRGPLTPAPCNVDLWNGRSSKTRAGVPCFGCVSPAFPPNRDLFETPKIGTIPKMLPLGVSRAKYMAYKNLAKAAAPERIINREMEP